MEATVGRKSMPVMSLSAREAHEAIYKVIIQASMEFGIDEEAAVALAIRSLEILQARG